MPHASPGGREQRPEAGLAVHLLDIEALEREPVPQLVKGACRAWPAFERWAGAPGLEHLRQQCGDAAVQVLCSTDGNFAGDMASRRTEPCSFADFLSGLSSSQSPSSSPQQQQRYLAQAPMLAGGDGGEPAPLAPLLRDVRLPASLQASGRLASVNLWMASRQGSATSLHYDQSHGLLCVLAGRKRLLLLAPSATPGLQPMPLWGESANHCRPDAASLAGCQQLGADAAKATRWELTAEAGDAVFIPEGYWHQIRSEAGTVAVNCWWESRVTRQLLHGPAAAYHLRHALRAAIDARAQAELARVAEHPGYAAADEGGEAFRGLVGRHVSECLAAHEGASLEAWQVAEQTMLPRELLAAALLAGPLCAEPQQRPGYAAVLKGLSAASTAGVLYFVACQAPAAIAALLEHASPTAMHLLIARFEELGEDEESAAHTCDFFDKLYAGLDGDALQQRMVQQQEAFQRQAAELLLRELLQLD